MEKSADAFRTISEVADDLDLPQHVLRFWETKFSQIRPLKRAGGRRYYRPADVGLLRTIRQLLYDQGYTIKGVQRLLREQGPKGLREGSFDTSALADTTMVQDIAIADLDEHTAIDERGDVVTFDAPDVSNDEIATEPPARTMLAEGPGATPTVGALRQVLTLIEECERILRAARESIPISSEARR